MSTIKYDLDKKSCRGLMGVMSPEQCRAARAWLGWAQKDPAKRASVGISTVKDFENKTRRPIANNLNALRSALEAAGIRFENDPKSGSAVGIKIDISGLKP